MANVQIGSPDESRRFSVVAPTYAELGEGRARATFPGDPTSLEVARERARSYPGLFGPAPRTEAIYRALEAEARDRHVLDIGCGSGVGLARLETARVRIGVDVSETAVRFASKLVRGATFSCLDAASCPLPHADLVTLIDVLGCVTEPRDFLRAGVRSLSEGGCLYVAEPRASVAQELMTPARRAFSKPGLTALLAEVGLAVGDWLSEGRFWVLSARPFKSPWVLGLERARELVRTGRAKDAILLLESLPDLPDPSSGSLEASWHLLCAETYRALGEGDATLRTLMRGHERSPEDARVLAALAEILAQNGEFEQASRFASAAVERDPAAPEAVRAVARASSHTSGPEQLVVLWQRALRLDPSSMDLSVRLAVAASEMGCYSVGTTALEKVREYGGALPADFHLTLGWLYLMMGRLDEALIECRFASLNEPTHPGAADLHLAICESDPKPFGQC